MNKEDGVELAASAPRSGVAEINRFLAEKGAAPTDLFFTFCFHWRFQDNRNVAAVLSGTHGCPACVSKEYGQEMIDSMSDHIIRSTVQGHLGYHHGKES